MYSIFSNFFKYIEQNTKFKINKDLARTTPQISYFSRLGKKQFRLSMILMLAAVLLSGCPKPQPVIQTHYEYVPPYTEEGLACTRAVRQKFNDCLGMDRLQAEVCRKEEERAAWERYELAQVRYENGLFRIKRTFRHRLVLQA